ncbi:response regulator transcription factor [Burkholderia stagnalis]|uniref:response regulator transcription factor n=1 Tax=Burkholderia stagnalis TaxID=1503054 RepID=UPI0007C753C2
MRIAILEDDPVQAEFIRQTLVADRRTCYVFQKGTALKQRLQRDTFDLLILDWYVPDLSGQMLLRWVRARKATHDLPVLFLTHRGDEASVVEILDAGADDYLVKPVTAALLGARVGALLRRVYPPGADPIRREFGPYRFDSVHQQAFVGNVPVNLTRKEFDLAWVLFQNLDRTLSRAYLIDRVWKRDAHFSERTLDTHASMVRTKLALRPANGYRLSSIYGYGYRLERLGDVARLANPGLPLASQGAESSGVRSTT